MALIVEDGTGLTNATSFVSRADYIAWAASRGVTIADTEATDVELVKAVDYIVSQCWKGTPTVEGQALPFPRHVENLDGTLVYADDAVPAGIISGQLHAALAIHNGVDLMPVLSGGAGIKREKIGPIETEYDTAQSYDRPTVPAFDAAVAAYQCGQGFSFRTVRV